MKRLFGEKSIEAVFKDNLNGITSEVNYLNENQLSFDVDKVSKPLVTKYCIKPLKIDFESRSSNVIMKSISGRSFPADYDVNRNQNYQRAYVEYSFSVYGDIELLEVAPMSRNFQFDLGIEIGRGSQGQPLLIMGYQTRYANLDLSDAVKIEVKNAMRPIVDEMSDMQIAINIEVDNFNKSLDSFVKLKVAERQDNLEKKRKLNADLNNF